MEFGGSFDYVKLYCPACDKLSLESGDGENYKCKACGMEAYLLGCIILYKRALKPEEILRIYKHKYENQR